MPLADEEGPWAFDFFKCGPNTLLSALRWLLATGTYHIHLSDKSHTCGRESREIKYTFPLKVESITSPQLPLTYMYYVAECRAALVAKNEKRTHCNIARLDSSILSQ